MQREHLETIMAEADCLADEKTVHAALDRMALEITAQLGDTMPVLLTVMTGSVVMAGLLMMRLRFPLEADYVHATRYSGQLSGSELRWLARPRTPLQGRTVLIVDDILDTGLTLAAVVDWCKAQGAAAIYTAVLCEKPDARLPGGLPVADFTGLQIPNRYVFGFGLDYKEYLRNAPGIYAVNGL